MWEFFAPRAGPVFFIGKFLGQADRAVFLAEIFRASPRKPFRSEKIFSGPSQFYNPGQEVSWGMLEEESVECEALDCEAQKFNLTELAQFVVFRDSFHLPRNCASPDIGMGTLIRASTCHSAREIKRIIEFERASNTSLISALEIGRVLCPHWANYWRLMARREFTVCK